MVNFLKYKWLYFLLSFTIIAAGLYSIFTWGYTYSVEFTGGSNIVLKLSKKIERNKVRKILEKNGIEVKEIKIQDKTLLLKTKELNENQIKKIEKILKAKVDRVEIVGPSIGEDLKRKTFIAAALSVAAILLYISFAFKSFNFALAAILAAIHDSLILFGTYSILSKIFGFEFDTLFVSAVLTTLSFSVHDTIVVFDKIREYKKEYGEADLEYYANKALTETMVRSVNNSLTIIFMLVALLVFGGNTIKNFVWALLIGTISGTYSSPFIATPLAVILEKRKAKK